MSQSVIIDTIYFYIYIYIYIFFFFFLEKQTHTQAGGEGNKTHFLYFKCFVWKIDAIMVCLEIEFSNSYLGYYNFYVHESFVQVEQFSLSLIAKAWVYQFDPGPLL